MKAEFFIGWDRREQTAWNVCVKSLLANMSFPYPISPISMQHLGDRYWRPTEVRDGRNYDVLSGAYCSTDFSLARFWAAMEKRAEWSIFMDGDFLIRHQVEDLLGQLDPRYAVMVVKHAPKETGEVKMDGQVQTAYDRKWWSSLMAFNTRHASNRHALQDAIGTRPGLFLHQFRWMPDAVIGGLDPAWNWIPGVSDPAVEPKAVHFSLGLPNMDVKYEDVAYAREWWAYA